MPTKKTEETAKTFVTFLENQDDGLRHLFSKVMNLHADDQFRTLSDQKLQAEIFKLIELACDQKAKKGGKA